MTPFFISHDLYLLFDPNSTLGRKTHALALSLNHVVHTIDIMGKTVTPLRWKEIIGMLGLSPKQLLNTGHPDYERIIAGKEYSEKDFLEVLYQNPQLVIGPIGILQNKAVLCDDPKDILKLDLTPGAEKAAYQF
jgi:arsenate reductase (glutaredoxin)